MNKIRQAIRRKNINPLLINILKALNNGTSVLDVGCGDGFLLKRMAFINNKIKRYGLDKTVNVFEKGIVFNEGDFLNNGYADNSFDFVVSTHVLEHVANNQEFVKQLHRILKKSAVCYIEVPYFTTCFLPDSTYNFWSDYTHIRPYSRDTLKRIFADNGFKVIKTGIYRSKKIIVWPYLFLKSIFLWDRSALANILNDIFGGSCYIIAKKKDMNEI